MRNVESILKGGLLILRTYVGCDVATACVCVVSVEFDC